jgi:hypothetical protein
MKSVVAVTEAIGASSMKVTRRHTSGTREVYSVREDSYQTLKKPQRLQMTLDGEPVAEIDIRASYLTLLHGLRRIPFDPAERDPYKIDHLPRAVVKTWVTMTIEHS